MQQTSFCHWYSDFSDNFPSVIDSYSTIAWITLVTVKHPGDVDYHPPKNVTGIDYGGNYDHEKLHHSDLVLQAFNAIGVIAFAYAAHNVVLDIQTDLPSPSQKAMMKGVRFTYIVVALCYFPLGIAVYWIYGNKISHNVLGFMMGNVSRGWVIATNIMLIVHLIGSYQVTHSTDIWRVLYPNIYFIDNTLFLSILCCFS